MSSTVRGAAAPRGAGTGPEVQGVTTAAAPRSADRDSRARVYVVQMAVRTACFVAALFTHGWWQLAFILAAVILPYVAVVRVNNTGPNSVGDRRDVPLSAPALPATPSEPARPAEPVVVAGEVVDDTMPRALARGRSAAGAGTRGSRAAS